jgi:hypothetical protein
LLQKPRATIDELRNSPGFPRVQVSEVLGTETSGAQKFPKAFWHMRQ